MTHDDLQEKCKSLGQELRDQWPRAKDERGAERHHDQKLLKGIDDLLQQSELPIEHDNYLLDCSFLVCKESLSIPNLDYGITFNKSEFKHEVELKGKVIKGPVDFSEANFANKADFSNSHFQNTLNLTKAVIGPRDKADNKNILVADFTHTEFEKYAILESSNFMWDAFFRHTKFLGDTNFRNIGFLPPSIADFSNACFEKPFTFKLRNFSQGAGKETKYIFEEAEFKSSAEIEGELYNVEFSKTKFCEIASFKKFSFYGIAKFNGASFEKLADFNAANGAKGKMDFVEARFNGKTEFFRKSPSVVMDLSKAYFAHAPHFSEEGLHPDTKIRTAQFAGFTTEDDYQNYRILKRECARIHAREEENIFHYCEMRTLAWLYLSHPRSLFWKLYPTYTFG